MNPSGAGELDFFSPKADCLSSKADGISIREAFCYEETVGPVTLKRSSSEIGRSEMQRLEKKSDAA